MLLQLWNAHEKSYNGLTLAAHGDDLERHAAANLGITNIFPNYESLWKRHVCPATTRPDGIAFRTGVSDVISIITQRCYSVLYNLVLAMESFAKVRAGDPGRWSHNCYDTIIYAGNSLQVLTELQYAICGKWENGKKKSTDDLFTRLGVPVTLFKDWDEQWRAQRESASNYRHYLTHQGHFYAVDDRESGKTLVLKRDGFNSRVAFPWTRAEAAYKENPSNWQTLDETCKEILSDTTAFLNRAYERLLEALDAQLRNPAYQELWGWDQSPPATTSPPLGIVAIQSNMSGSTSVGQFNEPPRCL